MGTAVLVLAKGLGINALMVAGMPIDGGHYFVDVLAGVIGVILSLAAVRALWLHASNRELRFPRITAATGS